MTDEQTDDLQGFPNVDRIEFTFVGHPLPAPVKIPPCTGYEADYERVEQAERDASWR